MRLQNAEIRLLSHGPKAENAVLVKMSQGIDSERGCLWKNVKKERDPLKRKKRTERIPMRTWLYGRIVVWLLKIVVAR